MDNGREDRLSGIDKNVSPVLWEDFFSPAGQFFFMLPSFLIIFNLFVLTTSSRSTFLVSQVGRVGDDVIWQSGMPLSAGGRVCSYIFIRSVLKEERQQRVCATATNEHFLLPFIPYTLCDAVAH